ncbi:uncharacterized protein LOC128527433 isoform X3 [Clarias gariepinus]|uniref:uncharacterized protein LOC128527433 isoform X3 n=1 Tax=Clarias gariepinus TaxID=13013 RepID=UPI00234D3D80|nr:uncharacterized protein LOC128527433 isoform X3 [Clarias gariepinus]XP_053355761.1 uncharacterized protein LOC128527433 isoform X3 [Clarias gariepinus]
MAEEQPRDVNEMAEIEADSETTLQADENVHCLLDEHGRFHTLVFKTSYREEWLKEIERRFESKVSYQMTKKCGVNDIYTFSMSGPGDEVRSFYEAFDQMYKEVMKKCGGAAAQRNQRGINYVVTFKSSDPEVWMRVIQNKITTIPSLLARKCGVNDNRIKLSGPADKVRCFCDSLGQMREEVKKIIKEDDEELEKKVSDLHLGNKTQKK